jgi:hypothetical protein
VVEEVAAAVVVAAAVAVVEAALVAAAVRKDALDAVPTMVSLPLSETVATCGRPTPARFR